MLKSIRLLRAVESVTSYKLLRGSDPWKMKGTLRLSEITQSYVCEVLTLNYKYTQVSQLLS